MRDPMQPILSMTPLVGLQVHVAQAGLSIGDSAEAALLPDANVGIYAAVRRNFLGLFPHRPMRLLGLLTPGAASLIAPALLAGQPFRIRIVGLTPEHLGPEPEVHVSIWGDPRRLLIPPPLTASV